MGLSNTILCNNYEGVFVIQLFIKVVFRRNKEFAYLLYIDPSSRSFISQYLDFYLISDC